MSQNLQLKQELINRQKVELNEKNEKLKEAGVAMVRLRDKMQALDLELDEAKTTLRWPLGETEGDCAGIFIRKSRSSSAAPTNRRQSADARCRTASVASAEDTSQILDAWSGVLYVLS